MPNEKKLDFKKEMERLDEIVDKISNKALPLDEALKLYEEGVKIVKDLEKQLELIINVIMGLLVEVTLVYQLRL